MVRFRNISEAHNNYVASMNAAISNTNSFYYNVVYEKLILYEVEGSSVKITTFTGNGGVKTTAYAKVSFDIKSILDGFFSYDKYRKKHISFLIQ